MQQLARDHPERLKTLRATCQAAEDAERSGSDIPEFTYGSVRRFDPSPSVNMGVFLRRGLIERSPKGKGRKDWYVMPYCREIEEAIVMLEPSQSRPDES